MSNKTVEGVVEAISENKFGFWNVLINETWYGVGKVKPNLQQYDTVRFQYTEKKDTNNPDRIYRNAIFKTIEVVDNSPAETSKSNDTASGNRYNDSQRMLCWRWAYSSAINLVTAMLQDDHEGKKMCPLPADVKKRAEVVENMVNKYHQEFYLASIDIDNYPSLEETTQTELEFE